MKKKVILRGISGLPIGIALGYVITVIISLIWGKGYYAPCVPELVDMVGSEIGAVVLQTVLCGVLGVGCAASSVIWEIEHWSLVKQTGIYFLIISIIMMPTAYFMYWMEHSVKGALSYFGIFVLIFVVIWVLQFVMGRRNVERMNENLRKVKNKENK